METAEMAIFRNTVDESSTDIQELKIRVNCVKNE